MNLKEAYLNLTDMQRAAIRWVLLAFVAVALSMFVVIPKVNAYKNDKTMIESVQKQNALFEKQVSGLKRTESIIATLDSDDLSTLSSNGNEVLLEVDVPRFEEVLKESNRKLGGKNTSVTEGKAVDAYATLVPGGKIYRLHKIPVTVKFSSNYSAATAWLAHLRSLKAFIRVADVQMESVDNTPVLSVTVTVEVFFTEG